MPDSNYSSVALLALFDGDAIPSSEKRGRAITAYGNPTVVTDASSITGKFLALDGVGDYVTMPGDSGLQLGSGDWTIDFQFKASSDGFLFAYEDAYSSNQKWSVLISSGKMALLQNPYNVSKYGSATTLTDGSAHHYAIVKSGANLYFFLDGVLDGASSAYSLTHTTDAARFSIGGQNGTTNAKISYVRISVGVARWTSGFTVPAASDLLLTYLTSASDYLSIGEQSSTLAWYRQDVASLFGFAAIASPYQWAMASESMGLSLDSREDVLRFAALLEIISLAASSSGLRLMQERTADVIQLASTSTPRVDWLATLLEVIHLSSGRAIAGDIDDLIDTWVANLATSAHSRYSQYGFNSFAKFGGKHYGCKSDGIYELGGETDGANPIPWTVTLGETDFGASNLKRFESVYLGVKSTGQLVLKVIGDNGTAYHYNVIPSGNDSRAARAVLGRGLAGRYWKLELASDTERAELDSIDFSFAAMSRRV